MNRNEQKTENTWALEDLFPSDEAWYAAFEQAKAFLPQVTALKGHLADSAETLLSAMKLEDEISLAVNALAEYAWRKGDEDTRVSKYQDMMARLSAYMVELSTAASYQSNEILAMEDDTLNRFYQECPQLEGYRRALELVRRRRAHILSPAEEQLLAGAGELSGDPDNIFSMLNDADMTFPDAVDSQGKPHPLTHGSFIPLMYAQDRALRKSAFEQLYGVYHQFRNTSAAVLSAQMKQLLFFSRARKYDSPLAAALDGNEVPEQVYHNLIAAVRANLPKMHRYTALRRKLLGVDELHFYDLYTPIVGDVEMKIPFDQAKQITLEALKPMGERYLSALREGYENRWIDVYENTGKRSGAYSAGARPHPYVLLNYHDTLNDLFTLIHEMGHSLHSYFSAATQPVVYSDYVIFVAEVASTCNEALLMQYLLGKTEDKRERAYLINYFLEQFRTTLYRQTMFAEFELEVSAMAQRGEGITADALCNLYRKLNEDYFGPDIVVDDQIALEWARIPHFFYNFYVYQYATGYAAAIALSTRILNEGEPAVKDYIGFLSGGSSADPITLLRGAGVDMATPQPVNQALELFDKLLDEMEELMG